MTTIRVLTWNIHKGFSLLGRKTTLVRMREALHASAADLVLLQEVVGRHDHHAARQSDWPEEPQAEFLAGGIWGHCAYAANASYPHGHHGNAVLSRFPLLDWENEDLSNSRFERRGLLHARLQLDGWHAPLHVMCTHLDLLHRGRIRQVERIARRLRALVPNGEPLLLAGDFNDWGEQLNDVLETEMGLLEAHRAVHGRLARSYPAALPLLPLDRLYVRGLEVRAARVLGGRAWQRLSDHAPLLFELQCPKTFTKRTVARTRD